MVAFKWFIYNCPEVNYLLKTDDDVFVNSPLLFKSLQAVSNQSDDQPGNVLICTEVVDPKVKRSYRSKWRVPYTTYHDKFYPNYCTGFSILYSADVVFQLYNHTQNIPYFWIDDVLITGITRAQLNITIAKSDSLFLSTNQQKHVLDKYKHEEISKFLFAQPDLAEEVIRKLWKIVT